MRTRIALVCLLLLTSYQLVGQTQLVLLNKERILARFVPGDDFIYKLKDKKGYVTSFITEIREFSVVTFNDTIQFASIDRVSLKGQPQRKGSRLLSKFLITAGVAYFVIDQFNNIVVQGNQPDMDPTVWKPSLVLVATGYAMRLFRKRSQRIRYPGRLLAVERGSKFYETGE